MEPRQNPQRSKTSPLQRLAVTETLGHVAARRPDGDPAELYHPTVPGTRDLERPVR
jgi:hypothetical protein